MKAEAELKQLCSALNNNSFENQPQLAGVGDGELSISYNATLLE